MVSYGIIWYHMVSYGILVFKSKSLVTISSSLWRFLPKKWYQVWPYLSHMLVSHMPKWNTLAQCPLGILSCISRWCHITPCEFMQTCPWLCARPKRDAAVNINLAAKWIHIFGSMCCWKWQRSGWYYVGILFAINGMSQNSHDKKIGECPLANSFQWKSGKVERLLGCGAGRGRQVISVSPVTAFFSRDFFKARRGWANHVGVAPKRSALLPDGHV